MGIKNARDASLSYRAIARVEKLGSRGREQMDTFKHRQMIIIDRSRREGEIIIRARRG